MMQKASHDNEVSDQIMKTKFVSRVIDINREMKKSKENILIIT